MKHLFFISALFIATFGNSQSNEEFAKFVQSTLSNLEIIPGISVAVTSDNEIIYTGGFGVGDVENNVRATSTTNFYIASSTKAFTGLMTSLIAENGSLDLNKNITSYKPFSDFENQDLFSGITIQDLLSHTSGVDNPYLSFRLAFSGDYTHQEILELVEDYSERLEKGKEFDYTNYGYYLISLIIKEELGLDWRKLMDEMIFSPTGMDGTTAFVSEDPMHARPYVALHKDELSAVQFKTDATMHAAGGLLLNAEDAAHFLQIFLSGGEVDGKRVFSEKVITRATTPVATQNDKKERIFTREYYANGWNIGKYNDDDVLYHFGGYTGAASHLSFIPERNLGVAVFVNHDLGMPVANLIASYAYEFYGGNKEKLRELEKKRDRDLPEMLEKRRKNHAKHLEKLAEREWDLELPPSSYEGAFFSNTMGTLTIGRTEESFRVSCGNMSTIATAFPEPNCLRVEVIPGSGTIIQFLPADQKADTLNWNGELFVRILEKEN